MGPQRLTGVYAKFQRAGLPCEGLAHFGNAPPPKDASLGQPSIVTFSASGFKLNGVVRQPPQSCPGGCPTSS